MLPLAPDWPITTGRLVIRPWTMDDLAAFVDIRSREEVVRYLYEVALGPSDSDLARERLAVRLSGRIDREDEWMNVAVVVDGVPVGDVGLCARPHRTFELGYVLHPDHWGEGVATEAAAALVSLAFSHGAHRIMADIDARNAASARVLERLGFRREAHFHQDQWVKGEWTDTYIYALLADEFPQAT
jgi:RimJ/RimL family protein N-acetyltransferase